MVMVLKPGGGSSVIRVLGAEDGGGAMVWGRRGALRMCRGGQQQRRGGHA